jgi:formate--tetrahydrofolate ligase
MHFTGDFHAITSANNLLAAMIDNHIYHGNALGIRSDTISFRRCMDMNDRSLRKITIPESKRTQARFTGFDITAASEVMAVVCLSSSIDELKSRLGDMTVARNNSRGPVFARDIEAVNAMSALLCDAIRPNLVQTLGGFPAIIHGGPFANIAHGCSSIVATRMGLRLADYAVTEAGFAADLGFEKYCDIVAAPRADELAPDIVVVTCTLGALKRQGGMHEDSLSEPSTAAVEKGFANLKKHAEIVGKVGTPLVVAVNKHPEDTNEELTLVRKLCMENGLKAAIVESYSLGGAGSTELAELILETNSQSGFTPLYDLAAPLDMKLQQLCRNVYGANGIDYSAAASESAAWITDNGFDRLPVCVAKTQYSLSDNPNLIGVPVDFKMHVNELQLRSGAGFIVAKMGPISTMPGLPAKPNALRIDVDNAGDLINVV